MSQPSLLQPEISKPTEPLPELGPFDLERMLSLELIRQHTKTDDVPHVTDAQLILYRQAAFEAAESYTGLVFSGKKRVSEDVRTRPTRRYGYQKWTGTYKYTLAHPVADGLVYLYGSIGGSVDRVLSVAPGATEVRIPIDHHALDMSSCCRGPCGDESINTGLKIMYYTGYDVCENVPAGILLGCLKFIAWSIENPGDTVTLQVLPGVKPQAGSNNAMWQSGAIEHWRMYTNEY